LKLSVVIPCRDDAKILDCVRSVDADAEILVVLNGSPPGFEDRLRHDAGDRIRLEILPSANRSLASERGIAVASFDRVLLMDSDCIFEPGSIAAVERALDRGTPDREVYKGRIVFDWATLRGTALVARSRTQRMGQTDTAYTPGLALSRALRDRLGGHFFDQRLPWKEDADLDYRVRRAGISVVPVEDCVIHHAALTVRGDLTSSFLYGAGAAIAEHLDVSLPKPRRSIVESLRRHGPGDALYMIVNNLVRSAGYSYGRAKLRRSRGRWPQG
jgi:glycosyltransferase involved in cell wall biosynthesis